MKRMAFFVEGATEVFFIKRLIEEITGHKKISIETQLIIGGISQPKAIIQRTVDLCETSDRYILIVNCQGDHQVKTRILEEFQSLSNKGYSKIIGVRDVRPDFTFDEITKLKQGLKYGIKTSSIPIEFVLSVMEIESIFLSETSHFKKIAPSITIEGIQSQLGFNPETEDMELRPNPADDLNDCYLIAGKRYNKTKSCNIINKLDFENIYFNLAKKSSSLPQLISNIENFLV